MLEKDKCDKIGYKDHLIQSMHFTNFEEFAFT